MIHRRAQWYTPFVATKSQGKPSRLRNPAVAEALFVALEELEGNMREAAKVAGLTPQSIYRHMRRDSAFALRVCEITGKEPPPGVVVGPEAARTPEVEVIPTGDRSVVEAEVVRSIPVQPAPATGDVLVPGLPPVTERNLTAFYWRTVNDAKTPVRLRSDCLKALHDITFARTSVARAEALREAGRGVGRGPGPAGLASSKPGIPGQAWETIKRKLIGPAPSGRDADDMDADEIVDFLEDEMPAAE